MGVTERRAREKEALRHKILEAASQLFLEEGFESVSIRKIAERIEYSPATIYLYFKDKAELVNAICEDSFAELLEVVNEASQDPDPLHGLRLGLRAYIDFGLSHPHHYLVVFGVLHKEQMADEHNTLEPLPGIAAFEVLRSGVRSCIQSGVLPPGDPETISQCVWMFIHGVTSLLITNYEMPCGYFPWLDKEHLIESSLDLLLAGLKNSSLPAQR